MPKERENMFAPLHFVDYDIAGNSLRAYYDFNNRLIFVLDNTTGEYKPNVLLVIAKDSDRKWDDILANDYGVDLETVRPKKDNKYQKLDIEYDGLDIYDQLIRGYNDAADLSAVLARLDNYRADAARNAANERLAAAEDTAAKSRETIAKAHDSIDEIQARIKRLRAQLAQYKSKIGKEPTKQSAAKILRTESQIEMAGVKLSRAKRRLDKAQKRLAAAADEADSAREMLARLNRRTPVAVPYDAADVPVVVATPPTPAPVEHNVNINIVDNTNPPVPSDEEVQPLFSKDPEILDEEIAFKPIEFTSFDTVSHDDEADASVVAPLAFTPPVASMPASSDTDFDLAPVLDTITSVDAPREDDAPVPAEHAPINVTPVAPAAPVSAPADVAPAPVSSDFRPVSPIVAPAPVMPVDAGETPARKPTTLYYVMLVVLIVLSIFTLWVYQRSTSGNVPDLAAVGNVADDIAPTDAMSDNPFITEPDVPMADVVTEVAVAPVVTPEPVADEPAPIPEPEPVEPEPVPEPEPAPAEPVVVPEPVPEPEPDPIPVAPILPVTVAEPEPVIATEAEVIASKPAYNVSQQDKMFVADTEYETDGPVCDDGNPPDMNGCCAGEVFTDLGGGTVACCQEYGGDCYPPM